MKNHFWHRFAASDAPKCALSNATIFRPLTNFYAEKSPKRWILGSFLGFLVIFMYENTFLRSKKRKSHFWALEGSKWPNNIIFWFGIFFDFWGSKIDFFDFWSKKSSFFDPKPTRTKKNCFWYPKLKIYRPPRWKIGFDIANMHFDAPNAPFPMQPFLGL